MLSVGDVVPDLELVNHDGSRFSLASLRGHAVVLYFFPRANTPGCTKETRGFAAEYEGLRQRGVVVIGVSTDPADRQRKFAADCQASFPIVPDTGRSVARAFGVLGFLGMARRVTFLIDPEGRVVEVVEGMRPGPHVEAALRRLAPGQPSGPAQASSRSK